MWSSLLSTRQPPTTTPCRRHAPVSQASAEGFGGEGPEGGRRKHLRLATAEEGGAGSVQVRRRAARGLHALPPSPGADSVSC